MSNDYGASIILSEGTVMTKVFIELTDTADSNYPAPVLFEMIRQKLDVTPGNGKWNTNTIELDADVNNENIVHPLLQGYVGTSRRRSIPLRDLEAMGALEK
ncbi:hypothetical protein NUV89_15430 [Pseudomonas sp. 18.1.10]|uniref:hypothetical protein n=1 Tax=Pseudomonas sp. 18.1.10 TaxID=2969302 RepID=UPI00214FC2E2|nr:hypothetical protein [Pseudomonas sp. 18.1.10]MCR4539789.1 hypothetical protein [Pseudomonas sp. 18.1.10]